MTCYLVSVEGPEPAWVTWDRNANLPRFTFQQPAGLSLAEAQQLKQQAEISCGGTLCVVPLED